MSWGLVTPLVIALAPAVLLGCATTAPSAAATAIGADCPKVEVAAILHVDAADPRVVWGTELASGQAIAVRPRPELGWTVRPGDDPNTIVGPDGAVVTFDGEIFRQACHDDATGTFYIGPEDLPDPDRAPN